MSDRVSASISIGGTVTRDQWAALLKLIEAEDLRTEWDGPAFTAATPLKSRALNLFAHDVPWGRFDPLEQYACDERIAYRRWSGGYPGSFGLKSSCSTAKVKTARSIMTPMRTSASSSTPKPLNSLAQCAQSAPISNPPRSSRRRW
jgi:hypothetical protein